MKKLLSLLSTVVIIGTSTTSLISCFDTNNEETSELITAKINQNKQLLTSDEMRKRENRNLRHSEFKPTGYFLKKDVTYEITLNRKGTDDEKENVKLLIGQWGQYANPMIKQNDNTFSNYEITDKKFLLTAKNSGVFYVADNNQTDLQIIDIQTNDLEDIIKIPTFKVNETSQSEFKKQVNATKSPFVEFVSEHYFATMQTDMIKNEVINSRLEDNYINAFVAGWDHGWHMTNKFWGLNEEDPGINHKYLQYIHIANLGL